MNRMKTITLLAAVFIFSIPAFSQDSAQNQTMSGDTMHQHHMMMHKMKDCVMMKNGKAMLMKNGKMMKMDTPVTLPDGTVITSDGSVKMSDGTMKTLKDGEYMNMDGTTGKMPAKGKMMMKKDSMM